MGDNMSIISIGAVTVLLGLSVFMAWLTVKSVRTGVVYRPWPQMRRNDGSIWFWINIVGLVVIGLAASAFALLLTFGAMAGYGVEH
jgi:hypothetical protein